MIVFLFNGCVDKNAHDLISAMEKAPTDKPLVVSFDAETSIECFDTESGKKTSGAEALVLFWKFCRNMI